MSIVHAEDAEKGSYDWYIESTEKYCKNGAWKNAVSKGIISIDPVLYPAIDDPNANKKYEYFIQSIKGDPSGLDQQIAENQQFPSLASDIELASQVYAQRMDAIYDCASYNTMLRSQDFVVKNVFAKIPVSPNFSAELKQKTIAITQRMKERKCRNISNATPGSDFSLKKILLDQSTLEYCNYRHYMYYVDYNVKNKLGSLIEATNKKTQSGGVQMASFDKTTDSLATELSSVSSRSQAEIANAKESYKRAFAAFSEFEREYPSHILSLVIISKLIEIRNHLDAIANPMSQLLEAGNNAQNTGGQ